MTPVPCRVKALAWFGPTELVRSRRVFSPTTDLLAPVSASLTKTVVLDTSVLVADPSAIHEFGGCALNVPLTVIEELDGLKGRPDGVGRAALDALRRIEVRAAVREILEFTRALAIVFTHDVDGALTLANRVIVLAGSPAEIAFAGTVGKTATRAAILDALGVRAGGGYLRASKQT